MPAWYRRLRARWRYRHFADDLTREIEAHRAMLEAETAGPGVADEMAARQRAGRALGDVVRAKEEARAVWIAPWLESVWQDLRYAVRTWRRQPAFTAAAWATIAVGLGLVGAMDTVAYSILARPLPVADEDSLVVAYATETGVRDDASVSYPKYEEWRASGALADLAAIAPTRLDVTGPDGITERMPVATVSLNFFQVVGASPQFGRVLGEADRGAAAVPTVISDAFWRRRFAGDPDVLGRTLTTNQGPLTVVGVMPPGFQRWPDPVHLWAPAEALQEAKVLSSRGYWLFRPIGRLHDGQTLAAATERLDVADRASPERDPAYAASATRTGVRLERLRATVVSPGLQRLVLVVAGGVALTWLVVCANLSNLLLARGVGRASEFAVRLAIGAHRHRVVRQVLVESLALALPGACLGAGLAWMTIRLVVRAAPAGLVDPETIWIDGPVLAAFAAATLVSALMFGLLPAFRSTRATLLDMARERVTRTRRGASVVLIGEIAVAVVILSGAALLVRSLVAVRSIDLGFEAADVVVLSLRLPDRGANHSDRQGAARFVPVQRELVDRLRALPGVEGAAFGGPIYRAGADYRVSIDLEDGRSFLNGDPETRPNAPLADFVGAGYFALHRVPITRGRALTERDGPSAPHVVVINEAMARALWPGEDPVGRRINFGLRRVTRDRKFVYDEPWAEVVGVAADVRHGGVDFPVRPAVFRSILQAPRQELTLALRSPLPMDRWMPAVRDAIRRVDPEIIVTRDRRLSDLVAEGSALVSYSSAALSVFAALTAALCGVGVYSLLAFVVAARRREMGIRMALGAAPGRLVRDVGRQVLRLLIPGLLLGGLAAMATTRVLGALLYDTSPTDPIVFVLVLMAVTVVVGAGGVLPARAASTVDPAEVLRAP